MGKRQKAFGTRTSPQRLLFPCFLVTKGEKTCFSVFPFSAQPSPSAAARQLRHADRREAHVRTAHAPSLTQPASAAGKSHNRQAVLSEHESKERKDTEGTSALERYRRILRTTPYRTMRKEGGRRRRVVSDALRPEYALRFALLRYRSSFLCFSISCSWCTSYFPSSTAKRVLKKTEEVMRQRLHPVVASLVGR